jgi:predicted outer membrane protein
LGKGENDADQSRFESIHICGRVIRFCDGRADAAESGATTADAISVSFCQRGVAGGQHQCEKRLEGDTMGDAQNRQMDRRFLGQVTQASLLNVAMGKLAVEKSSNDAVKEFGKKMVTDHERGLAIFKKVATKDGVTVEERLDSKHQERLDKLAKLSGPEFDRAYMKDQLKAHQRMVSYFQSEADNSTESTATKMANNMLPAVQRHLSDAKELNKSLTVVASAH